MKAQPQRNIYYTTTEAAAMTGRSPVTVRQLALAHNLGQLVNGRYRLLSAADIDFLRAIKQGQKLSRSDWPSDSQPGPQFLGR